MGHAHLSPELWSSLQSAVPDFGPGTSKPTEAELQDLWYNLTHSVAGDSGCTTRACANLSAWQIRSLGIAVRICASASILACILVIVSFVFSTHFHTPVNRLIFYATWGNIFAHTAELIAESGPIAGDTSSLCQFQAFFLQWFTSADALWNLCMAFNVFLVLFRRYSLPELRRLEWKYSTLCYGLQFIPAFVFFFIKTKSRGRVYGDALPWCWIRHTWGVLRLTVYYGPVWVALVVASVIYVAAGIKIYISEGGFKRLSLTEQLAMGAPAREDSAEQWTAATQQTGEVQISPRPEGSFTPGEQQVFQSQISSQRMSIFENQPLSRNEPGAEDSSAGSSASTISNWQKSENGPASPRGTGLDDQVAPEGISGPLVQTPARIHLDQQSSTRRLRSLDSLSILSDLTRPTSNIRNAVSPEGGPDIPLTLVSAPFLEIPEKKGTGRRGSFEARKGARAYTKFACLYFLSLAITWIPPTANRIYMFTRSGRTNYGLALAAAIGLPLQGLWNGVIFFSTSWKGVELMFKTIRSPQNWPSQAVSSPPASSLRRFRAWLRSRDMRPRFPWR